MQWFSALVEVDRRWPDVESWHEEEVDRIMRSLEQFHPALTTSRGWMAAQISLRANGLIDAAAQAIVVVSEAMQAPVLCIELMTEREFYDRNLPIYTAIAKRQTRKLNKKQEGV